MKRSTVILLCVVAVAIVVGFSYWWQSRHSARVVPERYTNESRQPRQHVYQSYDDFRPSLLAYNPTVNGVPIVDRTSMFRQAALNAGILPISAANQLLPTPEFKGQAAFDADVGVIQNSLEMSPTLEFQRTQVASAQTGFIPQAGIDGGQLWNMRTTIDKLQQPGFHV